MASASDHIALANRNHDALCALLPNAAQHPEWIATIAFYKAVHVVEAVFALDSSEHSYSHDDRIERLKRPAFHDLFMHYRPLYAASVIARYLEDSVSKKLDPSVTLTKRYKSFTCYMPAESVVKRLLRHRLKPLEEGSVRFLNDDCRTTLNRISDALANLK